MILWGSTFVVTKDVMVEFPPLALAFIRVTIGSMLLLPLAWSRQRRAAPDAPPLPWGTLFAMGFIGVASYYFLFNLAMVYISASQGALVQSSIPAITALVAVLWLREHASFTRIAGIVLSIIGVFVIFAGDASNTPAAQLGGIGGKWLGNLLMFGSVIGWGVYTSLAKRVAAFDPLVVTGYVMAFGAVMLLPTALYELSGRSLPHVTAVGCLQIPLVDMIMTSTVNVLMVKMAEEASKADKVRSFLDSRRAPLKEARERLEQTFVTF
jgi:drug/metabolite transporter (DMT)-like permease